jgi:hypothetical protein
MLKKITFNDKINDFKSAKDTSTDIINKLNSYSTVNHEDKDMVVDIMYPIFEKCNSLSEIQCSEALVNYFIKVCGLNGNWKYNKAKSVYEK